MIYKLFVIFWKGLFLKWMLFWFLGFFICLNVLNGMIIWFFWILCLLIWIVCLFLRVMVLLKRMRCIFFFIVCNVYGIFELCLINFWKVFKKFFNLLFMFCLFVSVVFMLYEVKWKVREIFGILVLIIMILNLVYGLIE